MMTRALHFVLKIADRQKSIHFYRDLLGMKVLRHEEFDKGCEASCNGPYQNAWSKTMIGYGPEESDFILELTYNYPITSYKLGNDIRSLVVESTSALERVKKEYCLDDNNQVHIEDPDGYPLSIRGGSNKLVQVSLNVKDLATSLDFWENVLGFPAAKKESKTASIHFEDTQFNLNFVEIGENINHETAWGRIAFAAPIAQVLVINKRVQEIGSQHILHPLVELGTPGKASVKVVILLDSDGYEICFVGDEDYKLLSQPDPNANSILEKALNKEKQVWEKRGGRK